MPVYSLPVRRGESLWPTWVSALASRNARIRSRPMTMPEFLRRRRDVENRIIAQDAVLRALQNRDRHLFASDKSLWGKLRNMSFSQAQKNGLVSDQEARAVELMRSVCDRERVEIYLKCGVLPARGNLTGRTYLVRRFKRVAEFHRNEVVAEWCIRLKPEYPETDNVVAMKNMIEGEEGEFRKQANLFAHKSCFDKNIPALPHLVDL